MKTTLCTLFNTHYLDKGLVLFNSLTENANEFELYVLAMDDRCYELLSLMNLPSLKPIKLSDFENDELKIAKSNRSFGEYCWTCTSSLIKFILLNFKPDSCTYIDADMYFYSDPRVIIEEMYSRGASVSMIGHRFNKYDKPLENKVGRYCVEFNTFKNDEKSLNLLDKWISQCLEFCGQKDDGIHWGDQKYTDCWTDKYDYVIESENLGAGVAPWNLQQYKLVSTNSDDIIVKIRNHNEKLFFYHFEGITFPNESQEIADIGVYAQWGVDDSLVNALYIPYLIKIFNKRRELKEQFSLDFTLKSHPVTGEDKESLIDKIIRVAKQIYTEGFNYLWYHSIPNLLFHHKNFIEI